MEEASVSPCCSNGKVLVAMGEGKFKEIVCPICKGKGGKGEVL